MAMTDLLTEFAARMGLGEVDLEEDGGGRLLLGDDREIDVVAEEDGDGVHISGGAGPLPVLDRENAYAAMLAANGDGLGTGGACLGIDLQRQEVVLRQHFRQTDCGIEQFDEAHEAFATAQEDWRKRSTSGDFAEPGAIDAGDDDPDHDPQDAPSHPGGLMV